MGYFSALDFAHHAPLETALSWHLSANHYPPLPACIVPVAVRVIEHARAGEWDAQVDLPDGCLWRGRSTAPVHACIEGWHLRAFLAVEGGDE